MVYFNFKYLIVFSNIAKNQVNANRFNQVFLITILNISYYLSYFFVQNYLVYFDICLLIQVFFIIAVIPSLYNSLVKITSYFMNFYEVIVFFLIDWFLMAALVQVLFVRNIHYYDHESLYTFNFRNYMKSLFSVFVFFTGNNQPEILIKDYPQNRALNSSFMMFIWINNIMITGLIIGLTYYKMKIQMSKEIEKCYRNEHKQKVFELLTEYPTMN